MVPIIQDGKIGDEAAVLERSTIRSADAIFTKVRPILCTIGGGALMEATEEMLFMACKKLYFNRGLVASAKTITAKTHLDFLLKLFTNEIKERDIKRRVAFATLFC